MKYIGLICTIAFIVAVAIAEINDTNLASLIVDWIYG